MNDDLQSLFYFITLKLVKFWHRLVQSTNLVALATAINVDGLKLGLGGNSHGGLDLNAENSD